MALVPGAIGPLQQALVFEREAVLAGQAWRLLSGHFVHFGAVHLALNAAAYALLAFWAIRAGRCRATMLLLLLGGPLLSGVLLITGATWYAGLSGLLHGIAVLLVLGLPGAARWLGLALIVGKLAWQSLGDNDGWIPLTQVSHLAHWTGAALGGVFYVLVQRQTRAH